MKLYSENEHYKLYNGNMLDLLEVIDKETIDAVLTDPPYELNFMGKGWDNSGIAFQPDTWKKCYEVLKPGGYLLAFGGSRTFHRIACAIEDAGFEIRDTIMWLYGSGFPKSMDISKQIDKRNGKQNEDFTKFGNYVKQCREAKKYSKNDIDKIMGTNTACAWWEGRMYKDDFIVQLPDKKNYYKLKEILDMNDDFDYLIEWQEAEREIIGEKVDIDGKPRSARLVNKCENASAWNLLDTDEKLKKATYLTTPATDLAKQWQGWGTALKPSFEPIIIARKPFKGSLVDNVIEYGVGGINIDECRVDAETNRRMCGTTEKSGETSFVLGAREETYTNNGRFPANTILTYDETDFDEVCGGFPNTKSGKAIRKNLTVSHFGNKAKPLNDLGYADSGSASRYFYCAKASKKDRDEGLDEFEEKPKTLTENKGRTFNDRCAICGKKFIGSPETICHCKNPITDKSKSAMSKNTHPTVKPTDLMQYLVRLVSPNGATILDPFNGSGSTGKAVMYENKERNKNYKYIGIELTEEYLPIAKARIEYVCNLTQEELKEQQMTIFDILESKGDE